MLDVLLVKVRYMCSFLCEYIYSALQYYKDPHTNIYLYNFVLKQILSSYTSLGSRPVVVQISI